MRHSEAARRSAAAGLAAALTLLVGACHPEEPQAPADRTLVDPPGPAGTLERVPLVLEPPPENVTAEHICDLEVRWRLGGATLDGVRDLLRTAGVEDSLAERFLGVTSCDASGCSIAPSLADVAALRKPARQVIYDALYAHPNDARRIRLIRRRASDTSLWADPSLSPDTRRAVDALSVTRGGDVQLPDPSALCELVRDPAEQLRLFQVLQRQHGVMLRLRVGPDSDLNALARYWGRGGREAEVHALLQWVVAGGGQHGIDVDYLLPPMPRSRLFSYPAPGRPSGDCHWTTLHFFEPAPVEQLADWALTHEAYLADFQEIPASEATFGDAVVFVLQAPDGEHFVHAAVLVANGIVFTKNGASAASPWALVPLDDLAARYAVQSNAIRWLRRRM